MRSERITGSGRSDYASLIPGETYQYINDSSCFVTGVRLFGEPCGAAVWEKEASGSTGRLLSIYVDPPCRRIGAGRELLYKVKDEMKEEGIKKGTYTVKVMVTAKGNSYYDKRTRTVTFKIKVTK